MKTKLFNFIYTGFLFFIFSCSNSSSNGFDISYTGDPRVDGEKVGLADCDCARKGIEDLMKVEKEILDNFESYKFKNIKECQDKVMKSLEEINTNTKLCVEHINSIDDEFEKKYHTDKELSEKYEYALKVTKKDCRKSIDELSNERLKTVNELGEKLRSLPGEQVEYFEGMDGD